MRGVADVEKVRACTPCIQAGDRCTVPTIGGGGYIRSGAAGKVRQCLRDTVGSRVFLQKGKEKEKWQTSGSKFERNAFVHGKQS